MHVPNTLAQLVQHTGGLKCSGAWFHEILMAGHISSVFGYRLGYKPISGGIRGQLMEQHPSYRAGFALDITLGGSLATYRNSLVEHLDLLASPAKQLEYEAAVPIADVHAELVCGLCDDIFHPKSAGFIAEFTELELKDIAHLYGLMVEAANLQVSNVRELLKQPEWRKVIASAKELRASL